MTTPTRYRDRELDVQIRRALSALVDLAPPPLPLDEAPSPAPRRPRPRRALVVVPVCVLIVGSALTAALAFRRRDDPAADPPFTSMPMTLPAPAPPSIPPPGPVPQELADPTPEPNAFPQHLERSNEALFPGSILHRSGGPYRSEAQIRERVTQLVRCGPEPTPETARCDGIVVRFFDTYARAFEDYGPPGWSYYVGFFGHDREVYLVTVYGALPSCNRGISRFSHCPTYRDHQNLVIDATTGEPLPL